MPSNYRTATLQVLVLDAIFFFAHVPKLVDDAAVFIVLFRPSLPTLLLGRPTISVPKNDRQLAWIRCCTQ